MVSNSVQFFPFEKCFSLHADDDLHKPVIRLRFQKLGVLTTVPGVDCQRQESASAERSSGVQYSNLILCVWLHPKQLWAWNRFTIVRSMQWAWNHLVFLVVNSPYTLTHPSVGICSIFQVVTPYHFAGYTPWYLIKLYISQIYPQYGWFHTHFGLLKSPFSLQKVLNGHRESSGNTAMSVAS